jgi:CRP-like cAMP-binding protein
MLEQLSPPLSVETLLPLKRARSVSSLTPQKNRLLEALPIEHYERLVPYLQLVPLQLGATIYGAGDVEKYVYFIVDGIVSRMHVMENGASAEAAVTGSEGVIGLASFLGGDCSTAHTVVVNPGFAYRLPGNMLKNEIAMAGPLLQVLLRYTQSLIAQCGQMAVCNLHHTLEQRMCRWIASSMDRMAGNELTITHAQLADLLGVRREGVSEAAGRLQGMGVIHNSRGHLKVCKRPQLEALACECYGLIKREFERSIGVKVEQRQRVHTLHVPPLFHQARGNVAQPLLA